MKDKCLFGFPNLFSYIVAFYDKIKRVRLLLATKVATGV